jgi:hypothetical protein
LKKIPEIRDGSRLSGAPVTAFNHENLPEALFLVSTDFAVTLVAVLTLTAHFYGRGLHDEIEEQVLSMHNLYRRNLRKLRTGICRWSHAGAS